MEGYNDSLKKLIKRFELKPQMIFQQPTFNIFYLYYFLLGIQKAQYANGDTPGVYNFNEIAEFNTFVDSKYGIYNEVPNIWYVNIMNKFKSEEDQNKEFFSLWNEFIEK